MAFFDWPPNGSGGITRIRGLKHKGMTATSFCRHAMSDAFILGTTNYLSHDGFFYMPPLGSFLFYQYDSTC